MIKYQFSRQDVIRLLTQLRKINVKYPPDLLAARRRLYLNLAAQLAVTRIAATTKKQQLLFSIEREPGSIVIRALILIFIAFLVAFIAHSIATGNIDLWWFLELLSR
jgi:hypothetical protein